METPAAKPSRAKRVLRRLLFVLVALITLAALALAEENWRGARAWENYQRDMEAKGEHFDAVHLIPPKVPDAENFAMTPYFAPLFDLPPEVLQRPVKIATNIDNGDPAVSAVGLEDAERGTNLGNYVPDSVIPRRDSYLRSYAVADDLIGLAKGCVGTNSGAASINITDPVQAASILLDHLQPCESTFAELRAAASRPYAQFNIPWDQWNNPHVISAILNQLSILKGLFRVLSLHAECEMVLGKTGAALDDIKVMFRMDDALANEPTIISQLVRLAGATILLQPVGEGLAERRWSDDQLKVLQEKLEKVDILASTVSGFRGDRDIVANPHFIGYMPISGWNRLEQINFNRGFQEVMLPQIDLAAREINPSIIRSIDLAFKKNHPGGVIAVFRHNLIVGMEMPGLEKIPQKAALAQTKVDQSMLACALERYRLARGQYPDDLNALIPRFVAVLPHDIINGQPLKYRRNPDGRFILYSVGWNEKDDGGVVATKSDPLRQDVLQGDWVWQYPAQP